jgi:putative Mg2+ transporter-C (MgtC) family protein
MDDLVALLISLGLGSLVGWERQAGRKPAGMRTHVLVCLGSTTFVLLQRHAELRFPGSADPTRLVAAVITGIGFLGAGTIMRTEGFVFGLTTAASIWMISAIGCAVGVHAYGLAAAVTVIVLLVLRGGRWVESKLAREEEPGERAR